VVGDVVGVLHVDAGGVLGVVWVGDRSGRSDGLQSHREEDFAAN